MIDLAVYNTDGKQVDTLKVEESAFGSRIRPELIKQAILMYRDNARVGTSATRSRGMVAGSTRKLFRQKGTGNARAGSVRTGKRVGGGVIFAKVTKDYRWQLPRKQRRLARDSAILAKLLSSNLIVVEKLDCDKPSTRGFAAILSRLQIVPSSCLVATKDLDQNVYKSARNIPRVEVMPVTQLNAGSICNYHKMLFTREAFLSLAGQAGEGEA